MTEDEQWQVREWVAAWRRAGPELERLRRLEIRAYRHEEQAEVIDGLLDMGARFAVPRMTSGFVEQQRIFRKLRP